jgi:hypothetical protein
LIADRDSRIIAFRKKISSVPLKRPVISTAGDTILDGRGNPVFPESRKPEPVKKCGVLYGKCQE